MNDLFDSFLKFANSVPFYGAVIACNDSEGINKIKDEIKRPITTYGLSPDADIYANNLSFDKMNSAYSLNFKNENIGKVNLNAPGKHNILNSLAAIAIGFESGLNKQTIIEGINSYQGVRRRFEIKGEVDDIIVIDDYAHHPTEVLATIETASVSWNRRIIAIFQPHLYSRTKEFYKDFAKALIKSDVTIITDIYPAREKPIEGVTGQLVYEELKKNGHANVIYEPNLEKLTHLVDGIVKQNDLVITLGAGTIWRYSELIVQNLKKRLKN